MIRDTRRDFFKKAGFGAAASAAMATGFLQTEIAKAEDAVGKKAKFQLGMASYTLRSFSQEEAIAMTKRLAMEQICFKSFHLPMDATDEECAAAATACREAGMTLYGGGVIKMSKPEEVDNAFRYAKAAGMTTIVGMLCLLSHIIIPAKQLGVLAAVGVGFAIIGSLVFTPAVLAVLPRAKPIFDANAADPSMANILDRMLLFFARSVARRPKAILIASVVLSAAMGIGASRVVVDTNPMSFYHPSEPVWRSTHLLNEHLILRQEMRVRSNHIFNCRFYGTGIITGNIWYTFICTG